MTKTVAIPTTISINPTPMFSINLVLLIVLTALIGYSKPKKCSNLGISVLFL